MRRRRFLTAAPALAAGVLPAWKADAAEDGQAAAIIALERAALDRWGRGDPKGFLELYAPEVTYFDPMHEGRLDGIAAMTDLYAPLTGKVRIERYEMSRAEVQRCGDMAVLSYSLVSHLKRAGGQEAAVRWNSTTVYQRVEGNWRIVHSHWSYTKPEMKRPVEEGVRG